MIYIVTIHVLDRWLKARAQVAEQAQAARNAVVARQLAEMKAALSVRLERVA